MRPEAQGGHDRTGALLRLWDRPCAGDGRDDRRLLSPMSYRWLSRASQSKARRFSSGQMFRTSRCGRAPARLQAGQLRHPRQRWCAMRHGRAVTAQPRLLSRRPRHARIRLRSQLSAFGPFDGATHHYAPVCSIACFYRYGARSGTLCHLLAKPEDAAALESSRQGPRRRSAALSLAAQEASLPTGTLFTPKLRVMRMLHRFILYGPASHCGEQSTTMVGQLNLFERPGGYP